MPAQVNVELLPGQLHPGPVVVKVAGPAVLHRRHGVAGPVDVAVLVAHLDPGNFAHERAGLVVLQRQHQAAAPVGVPPLLAVAERQKPRAGTLGRSRSRRCQHQQQQHGGGVQDKAERRHKQE